MGITKLVCTMTLNPADSRYHRDALARLGLKLSHLRFMAALRESGQISAAAAQLAISQPAASRLAAELEHMLQTPIYERHPRGVRLTEVGAHLAARSQTILRDLDDTARDIAEMSSGHGGHVSIGAVTGASIEQVLPVVRQIRVTHPRISVSIMVDSSDVLAEALINGRLDFYVGRVLRPEDRNLFNTFVIGEERIQLIVRRDHPLSLHRSVTLRDCAPYDWVLQPEGSLLRRAIETYFSDAGLEFPHKILSTSSLLLTHSMVAQSNAIAPVALSVAEFLVGVEGKFGRIIFLPAAEDLRIEPYALVSERSRALSPASQVVHDIIRQQFAAEAA
jgi:DNA-binding transcriptional LysR family regulator